MHLQRFCKQTLGSLMQTFYLTHTYKMHQYYLDAQYIYYIFYENSSCLGRTREGKAKFSNKKITTFTNVKKRFYITQNIPIYWISMLHLCLLQLITVKNFLLYLFLHLRSWMITLFAMYQWKCIGLSILHHLAEN